jgi:Ser/Thr protein kinase RdoA (MazF antagonist)
MSSDFFDSTTEQQIESFTKTAREMLAGYGLSEVEVKCINYEFNATFSVVTGGGDKYALRINVNSTRTLENMHGEIEFVNFIARVPGLKVPRPVANSRDSYISSIHHTESGKEVSGILYTWLEGEEIGDEPTHDQLIEVGAAMAKMHQSSRQFKPSQAAQLPTFSDWLWGTEDFLLSDKSLLTPEQFAAIKSAVEIIEADTRDLFAANPTQVIHGDLHGWNLMWHEGELFIFDFDDCGYGIPHQDIAITLYYLDTPEQDAAILEGYRSICELPTYTKAQMSSLLLQRRLVLLNYLYETKNPEHKAMLPAYLAKSMERVGGFLTDVRG